MVHAFTVFEVLSCLAFLTWQVFTCRSSCKAIFSNSPDSSSSTSESFEWFLFLFHGTCPIFISCFDKLSLTYAVPVGIFFADFMALFHLDFNELHFCSLSSVPENPLGLNSLFLFARRKDGGCWLVIGPFRRTSRRNEANTHFPIINHPLLLYLTYLGTYLLTYLHSNSLFWNLSLGITSFMYKTS
jgi:hypothetical protein